MYIKVKVQAGSKEEKIEEISKDYFYIKVKEPAERGLANKKVIKLVREYFKDYSNDRTVGQVYNNDIRIVSGHHSPRKIISMDNN